MAATVKRQQDAVEKEGLFSQLHDAVKQCQIRFGGKSELATEIDKSVNVLCMRWENVFHHGLKCNMNSKAISTFKQLSHVTGLSKIGSKINVTEESRGFEIEPAFWMFVKDLLSRHEYQRYMSLKNISTDTGRGLAWLRSALNEHSLEKYLQMMIGSPELLSQFYEDWALLRDEEKSSLLPNMAAGLGSILFAISIDNPSLNVEKPASVSSSSFSSRQAALCSFPFDDETVIQPAITKTASHAAASESKKDKKRKKKPAKIITFDSEDVSSCSASPASCVVSPQENVSATSSAARSKDVSSSDDSIPITSRHSMVNGKQGISDGNFSEHGGSMVHGKTSGVELPHRFLFDGLELQNSADHMNAQETPFSRYDRRQDESNAFHSDDPGPREPYIASNARTGTSSATSLGNLKRTSSANVVGNVDYSGKNKLESLSALDFSTTAQATGVIQQTDCDVGSGVVNPVLSLKSVKGLSRTLPHSDSTASNTSMASACSISSNLITCDVDSNISLVPLNAEGKPLELDVSARSIDGDTNSESYGSYDSHEMQFGEMTYRPTSVENERTLHNSFTRFESSVSAPDIVNTFADAVPYEDLKEALIMMMMRKDEAEDQSRRLQAALDAERQSVASLQKEIDEKHRAELERMEKNSERNSALMRENELLKNQLKKYISAVQMLRQGASVEDFPGIHLDTSLPPVIPPKRSSVDYSFEAEQYEKKLIQVAEMHGELMEFNEVLQRQLVIRETQLKHITGELVSLRGPLPSQIAQHDSELIANSSNVTVNAGISTPTLINIWIPSAFLRGSSSDAHHVYQIYIHIQNEEWNIYRRYAEFFELHCKLKKKYPSISSFDFPPKKAFGKKDPKIVEVRRKKLEAYLRQVVQLLTEQTRTLAETPSRQVLTATLPFFSETAKTENTKHRSRRSRDRSSRSATVNASSSSEALTRNPQLYMGL